MTQNPYTKGDVMTEPRIEKVAGRVSWVGTFGYGEGKEAVKIVLSPDDGQPKKFGDRVEVLVFREALMELLKDEHVNPDGKNYLGGEHVREGDHLTVKGPYTSEPWKKGRKKGTNRKLVLARKDNLTWQKVRKQALNPWASGEADDEVDPT
jgi:hypothetical protein